MYFFKKNGLPLQKKKMNKIIKEFRDFSVKGNMIDMAVGIIIGGGFGKIVSSLVNDILMPPIGMLLGNVNFSDLKLIMKEAYIDTTTGIEYPDVSFNYGNFIQTLIDFTIIAFSVFLIVKITNKLRDFGKEKSGKTETTETTSDKTETTKEE